MPHRRGAPFRYLGARHGYGGMPGSMWRAGCSRGYCGPGPVIYPAPIVASSAYAASGASANDDVGDTLKKGAEGAVGVGITAILLTLLGSAAFVGLMIALIVFLVRRSKK